MKFYFEDNHDLYCDMEDGKKHIKMGWIQNRDHIDFYCMCTWMTDRQHDSYERPWLWQTAYPEEHLFATEDEARQALIDASVVAIIGGFRGRAGR